jgi:hypothetical protein
MGYARWSVLLLVIAAFVSLALFHAHHWLRRTDSLQANDDNSGAVFGRVYDDQGPVAGANVRFKGAADAVRSDADGRFRLPRSASGSTRITAWKEGYRIGGAPVTTSPVVIRLAPLPRQDDEHYAWVDPEPDPVRAPNCGNCHAEIYREWAAGGHAGSVSDRHFLNLYDGTDWHGRQNVGWSLLAEHPDGAGVCTSCHAPTVAFTDLAYYDLRKAHGTAARGVHCDYCHKIAEVANEQIGLTHGRFGLKLLRPAEGQLFFGPFDDVDRGEDAFAAIYRDSRYCASCHEGTVFGVPVYTTYSEWLASPARREGKQCQTCHMAPTGRFDNMAPGKGGIRRDPRTLANHSFFAGNKSEMLKRCLKLHLVLSANGQELQAEVEVRTDQVGHRVPTGFADRNLVLVVEGFDNAGQAVAPRTGPLLPDRAGKRFAGSLGRIYAKQLSDFDGHTPVPFWRAQPDSNDSRLIPGRPDRISAHFPPGLSRLRVRLLYRRFWEEVAVAKDWPDNETTLLDESLAVPPGKQVDWTGP